MHAGVSRGCVGMMGTPTSAQAVACVSVEAFRQLPGAPTATLLRPHGISYDVGRKKRRGRPEETVAAPASGTCTRRVDTLVICHIVAVMHAWIYALLILGCQGTPSTAVLSRVPVPGSPHEPRVAVARAVEWASSPHARDLSFMSFDGVFMS